MVFLYRTHRYLFGFVNKNFGVWAEWSIPHSVLQVLWPLVLFLLILSLSILIVWKVATRGCDDSCEQRKLEVFCRRLHAIVLSIVKES
jgi:hypothetical protein